MNATKSGSPPARRGGARSAPVGGAVHTDSLVLNLVPISFSKATVSVGRVDYAHEEQYEQLRSDNRESHVFRFDNRDRKIANVSLSPGVLPKGVIREQEEPVQEHLLLLGKVVQHSVVEWLKRRRTILKRSRPVVFWGGKDQAMLLSRAIIEHGLDPQHGLEVIARYSLGTRVLGTPNDPTGHFLALVIELSTSNTIDVPLSVLIDAGLDLRGRYVCRRTKPEKDHFRPRPELLGAVADIDGEDLILTDNPGDQRVPASSVWLEARQENLEAVVHALFPNDASGILRRLKQLRSNYVTANGKLRLIRDTLAGLKANHTVTTGDGLAITFGDLLTPDSALFPERIATDRPNLLFGPQGRNQSLYPDPGVQRWGPFKYMQSDRNAPVIAVLCEAQHRGRVEQFVQDLCYGFPDDAWEAATSWMRDKKENPFRGGLAEKFRLGRIALEYEEVNGRDAQAYREAADRLLARVPRTPDIAIVQIQRAFEDLHGNHNPYLVSKAVFMQAGVPVQAVHKENVGAADHQLPRILNNLALACYAKLGGVPWVISTRNPTSHELVVGMGYTEMGLSRLSSKTRYVGITTLFQGDGRYQVWGLTREVEFDDYAAALLENLRTTVSYVREDNDWQAGDSVRLIFHVYKPLKHKEMDAIKALVNGLIAEDFDTKYAFLDLSHHHSFQLFDPSQNGVPYGSGKHRALRGSGVPARGLALQLDERSALLHLKGPRELKQDFQGLPHPLRIELHPESDFDDLTYLVRQVYHFTYMSWRSFFPAGEPVTVMYSRMIAKALGSLKPIDGWNSSVLTVGQLRGSMWFL